MNKRKTTCTFMCVCLFAASLTSTKVLLKNVSMGAGGFIPLTKYGENHISLISFYTFSDFVIATSRKSRFGVCVGITLPFASSLWISIALTFMFGVIVIISLRFVRPTFRNFIVGRFIQSPIMHLIASGLGQNVSREPRRNFARTLIIYWIILMFVIRNVYLGKQFDILHFGTTRWALETYKDVEESGYPVFAEKQYCEFIRNTSLAPKRLTCVMKTANEMLSALQDEDYEGTVLTSLLNIDYYDLKRQKERLLSRNTLYVKDFRIHIRSTLVLVKNSHLKSLLVRDLLHLGGAGLLQKWVQNITTLKPIDHSQPFKLSLKNLAGVFYIFFDGILLAGIVFWVELIWKRIYS